MAKATPPSVQRTIEEPKKQRKSKPKEPKGIELVEVPLSVPMATIDHGYTPRRVDVNRLTSVQSQQLRRVLNGLIARKAVLANGGRVKSLQDAFKWILEGLVDV